LKLVLHIGQIDIVDMFVEYLEEFETPKGWPDESYRSQFVEYLEEFETHTGILFLRQKFLFVEYLEEFETLDVKPSQTPSWIVRRIPSRV
jgi:hypothetical protein